MKSHRQRIDIGHPTVPLYRLEQEMPPISDKLRQKIDRYNVIRLASQTYASDAQNARSVSDEEIAEIRSLHPEISLALRELFTGKYMSVLSDSALEPVEPFATGTDSHVFDGANDRRVHKYSVPSLQATPEHVEYLQKKYELLRLFLAEHIPQSAFILGERYRTFKKANPDQALETDRRCITMQRRIPGQTFKEMSPAERARPEVLRALRIAHAKYAYAKQMVRERCIACGFKANALDVRLDIGALSKAGNQQELDEGLVQTFSSPNVMYEDGAQHVYFVDFGSGKWDPEKQAVYEALMEPVGTEASSC